MVCVLDNTIMTQYQMTQLYASLCLYVHFPEGGYVNNYLHHQTLSEYVF